MSHSRADYRELQRSTTTLEEIAARDGSNAVVTFGLPESVRVVLFTSNAFEHFGVPAMAGLTAVLAFAGLLACWFPVRRATAIDPMAALRHD